MTVNEELERLFLNFGVTLDDVINNFWLVDDKNDPIQDSAGLLSLCLSMASLVIGDAKNVLELGTGLGERTAILSGLFPKAQIYTLDLPREDPAFNRVAWRGLPQKKDGPGKFKRNIDRENITYINSNSFFLPSLGLPKAFELILVDGGHTYPAVAWDIMFSYSRLSDGGFMFMHDYSTENETLKVKDVVDYISERIKEKVYYFPGSVRLEEFKKNLIPCIRKGK